MLQQARQVVESNERLMVFRLGFGRFAVLGGVSVSGVPHGFPSPGSRLTQDLEGILSSREDLGSYSSCFITSLWKLNENLVFEVQVAKTKVSVFFYVVVTSRNLKKATRRALSAVQGICGAACGAYGRNVEVLILNRKELMSTINSGLGGAMVSRIRLVKKGDETDHQFDGHGVVAEATTVDRANSSLIGILRGVRYLGILELRGSLPALKASDRENQISRMIDSMLNMDMANASFIVNLKPHRISFIRKYSARGKAKTLMTRHDLKDDLRSFQDSLDDEKTVKELNEIRYGQWSGYWKVSAHLVLDSKSALGVLRSLEIARASLTSIFSDPHFMVELEALKGGGLIRALREFPMRRLSSSRPVEMSSVRLSALVHMPAQAYPGIDRKELPEFEVPKAPEESKDGKLVLGRVLHGDRELYPVGIDLTDLSLNMVVVGHIGSGKTMFVSQLLLSLWEVDPSIGWLVFDVKGEYSPITDLLPESVEIYRAGDESSPLKLNIFDPGVDSPENHALKLFAILRDALSSLFEASSELSPQMERLCREALMKAIADKRRLSFQGFYLCLEEQAKQMQANTPTIMSSLEAIKNRVEKFRHGVLRNVFDVDSMNLDFDNILGEKVIIDLSFLLANGGTKDDVRLLMNVVLKNMFDRAMKLGLSRSVRHIVVVEEAGLLVPEVFSRKTSSETTPAEDIVLVERALGEGMILVSPRPTISENILANSGTKVMFRCPYDSRRVARFLNLNEVQENYLKVLPKREAIIMMPDYPYPFRIKTLDSELSKMPLPKPRTESAAATASSNEQLDDSLIEDDDEDLNSYDDLDYTPNLGTLDEEENSRGDKTSSGDGDIDGRVDAKDLKRLLKKGLDSDRFKFLKKVALRSPEPVEASMIVEEEFGGEWWRLTDTYRVLLDEAWSKPLVKTVGDLHNEKEGIFFRLTEYGEKVWKAVRAETRTDSRRH
jgi:hypothetical protein